jgi:two-component system, chemotaxis family, chemotaxis protein CheY
VKISDKPNKELIAMISLVVEDDFTSRVVMQRLLLPYGECHVAVDGKEALIAYETMLEARSKYDLICLDIMMPEMDGQEVLTEIRKMEKAKGIFPSEAAKIIMTTALSDPKNVMQAFKGQCEAYLVKPFKKDKLLEILNDLRLIP